jgi:hypothetical protein
MYLYTGYIIWFDVNTAIRLADPPEEKLIILPWTGFELTSLVLVDWFCRILIKHKDIWHRIKVGIELGVF